MASIRWVSRSASTAVRAATQTRKRTSIAPAAHIERLDGGGITFAQTPWSLPLSRPMCPARPILTTLTPKSSQHRFQSTLATVKAAPEADREAPTPVVFIHAKRFNPAQTCHDIFTHYISAFSSQGYECIVVDIDPTSLPTDTSTAIMSKLEDDLSSTLRTASPFPPIMIASGLSCLLGEQYASSHPLSALILVDPPLSNAQAHEDHKDLLPTPWDEYDFEPFFPVTVAWTNRGTPQRDAYHRIEEVEDREDRHLLDDDALTAVKNLVTWLEDECGVIDEEGQEEDNDDDAEDEAVISSMPSSSSSNPPDWYDPTQYITQRGNKKQPILIPSHHLREAFSRGGGKGGQAINKNTSRCDLTHIPTGLLVRCQQTRSLDRNREIARRRLSKMVEFYIKGEESVIGLERIRERRRKERKQKKQKARHRASLEVSEDKEKGSKGEETKLSGKQKRALRQQSKEDKAAASKGKKK